jgi:hypothetical protein
MSKLTAKEINVVLQTIPKYNNTMKDYNTASLEKLAGYQEALNDVRGLFVKQGVTFEIDGKYINLDLSGNSNEQAVSLFKMMLEEFPYASADVEERKKEKKK